MSAASGVSPSPPDSSLDEATEEGFILVSHEAQQTRACVLSCHVGNALCIYACYFCQYISWFFMAWRWRHICVGSISMYNEIVIQQRAHCTTDNRLQTTDEVDQYGTST